MAERSLTYRGIAAFKAGNHEEARRFFTAAVQENPRNATAWLGLAACIDDPARKQFCLQKTLALDPQNAAAQRMLARLEAPVQVQPPPSAPASLPIPPAPPPPFASQQSDRPPELQLRDQLLESSPPAYEPAHPDAAPGPVAPRRPRLLIAAVLTLLGLILLGTVGWWLFTRYLQPRLAARAAAIPTQEGGLPALPGSTLPPSTSPGEDQPITANPNFQQLFRFGGGLLSDMALTPDGNTLVLATSLGIDLYALQEWSAGAAPPEALRSISTRMPVVSLALSPDGARIAAVLGSDPHGAQQIAIWNLTSGELLAQMDTSRRLDKESQLVYDPFDSRVTAVLFSPDGSQLIGRKSPLVYWNTADGSFLKSGPTGRANGHIIFAPDGNSYATCEDVEVILWNAASEQLIHSFPVGTGPLARGCGGLAFSPDGRRLLSANANGAVDLWDVASGQRVDLPDDISAMPGLAAAFSPDGASLVVGRTEYIALWQDNTAPAPLSTPVSEPPEKILFTADGEHMLTLGQGVLRLWKKSDLSLMATLPGHEDYRQAKLSPDGKMLAVALPEGGVRIRQVSNGAELASFGGAQTYRVLGFSPDNQQLAVLGNGLEFWKTGGGMASSLEIQGKFQALNPDWNSFLTLQDETLSLFTLPAGKPVWSQTLRGTVLHAAYTPGGSIAVTAAGEDYFLQPDDGRELYTLPSANAPGQIAVSPNRALLVTAQGLEGNVWQVANGELLASFPLDEENARFDFTNNSRYLAASTRTGLHLLNPSNGEETLFLKDCSCAVFSPNSSTLFCYDPARAALKLLPVYDQAGKIELGSEMLSPADLNEGVDQWFFLPGRQQLVILARDGTARLWQYP
ncbi:MAG: tetratricopeptide repeat protein [Anaerolineaceae bacterium]|nr:tetratricopeptide repeat protein [Anaerolineaceae bacterium]